jgi:plasmid stabilization system protein ParE
MSPRQIDIHPEAVAEARAAARWYRERSALAADAFLAELDLAVERIAENPEMYPKYVRGTRRYLLQRSPFYLVYREHPEKLEFVAKSPQIGPKLKELLTKKK